MYKEDNKSIRWILLIILLFVPVLDFILCARWKRSDPQAADFILGIAIISTMLYVVAGIIIGVVLVFYDVNSPPLIQYTNSSYKTITNSDEYSNNSNSSTTKENTVEDSDVSNTTTDSSNFNSSTSDTVTTSPSTATDNLETDSDTFKVSSELELLPDNSSKNTSDTEQDTSKFDLASESNTTSNNTVNPNGEQNYNRITVSLIIIVTMSIGTLIIQNYQKENNQYNSQNNKQNNKQKIRRENKNK